MTDLVSPHAFITPHLHPKHKNSNRSNAHSTTTRYEGTEWGTPLASTDALRGAAKRAGYMPLEHQNKSSIGVEIHAHPDSRRLFLQHNQDRTSVVEHRVPYTGTPRELPHSGGTHKGKPRLLSGRPSSRSPFSRRR